MRRKLPRGNAVVLAVLRSRAHRLLSGLALELQYTGRRSGRRYVLPVQYARDGDQLVLWPQSPERKTWWRNFQTPGTVSVRLAGRMYEGTARLVDRDDPEWGAARTLYASRWRRLEPRLTGPGVVISVDT